MNFNKIVILLITLAFVASVGVVAAENASVGPFTFTVPDGYTVVNTTDNLVVMQKDANNVVNFATGVGDDIESSKQSLIAEGNELIEESTLNYQNMEINLQAFKFNNGQMLSYNYILLSDDGNFAVTVVTDDTNFDGDLEAEGNPASIIFDSVVVN